MKRKDPTPGSEQQAQTQNGPPGGEPSSQQQRHGEAEVVLLPVTPDRVFAFWEIEEEPVGNDNRSSAPPENQAVLRLQESSAPSSRSHRQGTHEIPIKPHAGSRYVKLQQAGCTCEAEIGFAGEEGQFIPAAQSKVIDTPRPLPPPEKINSHPPAEGNGRPAIFPTITRPSPDLAGQPDQSPGLLSPEGPEFLSVEESERAMPVNEEFLVKRRLAIFRHLSEAVPLAEAGSLPTAVQTDRFSAKSGLPRQNDLTEISEQKFVAGISSR